MGPELSFVPCPLVHVSAIRWAGSMAKLSYAEGAQESLQSTYTKLVPMQGLLMGLTQIETLK